MKLTKQQRFTAYCIMLEESEELVKGDSNRQFFNGGYISGLCDILGNIVGDDDMNILETIGLLELCEKKPKTDGSYWFPDNEWGWQQRIELLKQCIEETF